MLHIVNTMLEDAIMSFKLTVGWTPGTEYFEGAMEEHRRVLELNAVNDEITDIWRKLPVEQRKPIEDRRQRTRNADDETALKDARALLEEVKALYLKGGEQRNKAARAAARAEQEAQEKADKALVLEASGHE